MSAYHYIYPLTTWSTIGHQNNSVNDVRTAAATRENTQYGMLHVKYVWLGFYQIFIIRLGGWDDI